MADALKTFREGEDILASETNDNNQFLLSKLSDNAAQVQNYVEGEVATIKSSVASVQATLQNNIAESIAELDAKKPTYIVKTYVNGSAWYRIYSDGWCEQGGGISNDNATITLLKPFANTNYTCLCVCSYSRINENFYIDSKTTTTFHARYASGGSWFACGQLAEGEN